jgi:putative endonuclease
MGVGWMGVQAWGLRRLDGLAARRGRRLPEHLALGLRGEREAVFELRRRGYTVVARRWKSTKLRGDVDLIGWDGEWLCFVEVKTRAGRDAMSPAEAAVDEDKRRILRRLARVYVKSLPEGLRETVLVRFDVVAVYVRDAGVEFEIFPGAFGWA